MIYLRQGNDYIGNGRVRLTFTDLDTGDPIDITGFDLWFAIKSKRQGIADADAYILKTTDDDVEADADQVTNTGLAYVTLTNVETAAIPVGAWWFSAQGKDGEGRVVEVASSRVTVEPDFIVATEVA
jgi:hypothetical protein